MARLIDVAAVLKRLGPESPPAGLECRGKEVFESRAVAARVHQRMVRNGRSRLKVYRCPGCNRYHIGARPPKA